MESQKSEPVKVMSLPNLSRHAEIVNDMAWDLRKKYQGDECAEKLSDASSGLLRQWRYRQRLVSIMMTVSSLLTIVCCLVAWIWYKWQQDTEFQLLTSVSAISVQPFDVGPQKDIVRYADAVERMAERNPPFGASNPWRNSYWLIEWVRSANSHFRVAKNHRSEGGCLS